MALVSLQFSSQSHLSKVARALALVIAIAASVLLTDVSHARYCEALFDHTKTKAAAEAQEPFSTLKHSGASFYNPRTDFRTIRSSQSLVARPVSSDLPGERVVLPLSEIHFMQATASNNMSVGGHTVIDTARALKSGQIQVEDIQAIRVWRDAMGRIWTLDHRRVAAMVLAGLKEAPAQWATLAEAERESYKLGSASSGRLMLLRISDFEGILIDQPGASKNKLTVKQKASLIRQYSNKELAASLVRELRGLRFDDVSTYGNKMLLNPDVDPQSAGKVVNLLIRKNESLDDRPQLLELSEIRAQFDSVEVTPVVTNAGGTNENSAAQQSEDILALAKKIHSGQVSITSLPTPRVWQDRYGRVWTPDLNTLAALRLGLEAQAKVPVQWVTARDLSKAERLVTSRTLGKSLAIRLKEHTISLITVYE